MGVTNFNPNTANDLAKFQGTFVGIQAGNAPTLGTAVAPTSVYNQAGFTAVQDTDTGYVTLQKTGGESLFTGQWYDQGTGINFNIANNNNATNTTNAANTNSIYTTNLPTYQQTTTTTTVYGNQSNNDYPWSQGYTIEDSSDVYVNGNNTQTNTDADAENSISAKQLQKLVDKGIYKDLNEALNETLANGYQVDDDEQAKLGLYSKDDESKIQTMMDTYGMTREEAVQSLDGKIAEAGANSQAEELEAQLAEVEDNQGFLGKMWNGIKSFFGAGTKYDDAKYAIEQFKKGEISYDEAKNVVDQYGEKQGKATEGLKTGAALVAGTIAGIFTGGIGGVLVGAAVKGGLGAADRASNKNNEDDGLNKHVAKDVLTGAIDGGIGGVGGKFVHGAGTAVKVAATAARGAAAYGVHKIEDSDKED